MKKDTRWITIPEDTLHTPVSTPAKKSEGPKSMASAPVKNKFFWGVGFVAVVLVSSAMLAPDQFNTIIQGNLFDAPGVIPPTLTQTVSSLGILPSGAPSATSSTPEFLVTLPANLDQVVVQPETTPVSVQVVPLVSAPLPSVPAPDPIALDANARLIAELKKQVEDLKAQQQQTAAAPAPVDLHAAASTEAATTTTFLGQTSPEGYRLNAHRAPVSPQVVLQQNLAGGYRAVPSSAASVPSSTYRANLSGVRGTPDSGPREVTTIALIMTFLIVIGWKGYKLSRS